MKHISSDSQDKQTTNLLEHALEYHLRRWAVIPVRGKKPPYRLEWKRYQQRQPTESELRAEFSRKRLTGLAVLLGPVSGGLYVRDFDKADAYEKWVAEHPKLAKKLPTVRTARGYHVYFRSKAPLQTRMFDDGELRGAGAYCVLPPSQHRSGCLYEWVVPLPACDVPVVDCNAVGLASSWNKNTSTSSSLLNPPLSSLPSLPSLCNGKNMTRQNLEDSIAEALDRALPNEEHQNHKCLFELARALKTIEKRWGQTFSDQELMDVFGRWHHAATPYLRQGQAKEEYLFEFLEAYERVKYALGDGLLNKAWKQAQEAPLPKVAEQFEKPAMRLLVALCRELQRTAKKEPFFLSCRMAQAVLKLPSYRTAADWLKGLVRIKIIKVAEKGGPDTNKATRFRYLHSMKD